MSKQSEAVEKVTQVMAGYRTCDGPGCGVRDWTPANPDVTQPREGWISATLYTAERFGQEVDFHTTACAAAFFAGEAD